MMLTCKQVSAALSRGDYTKLTRMNRLGLRLHVMMCIVCGRYNRQVMLFYDTVRAFMANEERGGADPAVKLPEATRARMRDALEATAARRGDPGNA